MMIAQQHDLPPILARILAARGVDSANVASYLDPKLRDLMPDPFILQGMEKASEEIASAIINGRQVGVFGDYDVDGVSAAAILKSYFTSIDAPLLVYLPDRITEGYGPNVSAFRSLKADGADLIVTVDCGASAHEPIEEAASDGIDIVVLDHHQMSDCGPPHAVAVVNPNRPDDLSGLVNLSAAGVAFLTVAAVQRRLREAGWFKTRNEPKLMGLLDLTALGLVCDVMEMTGLTRVLVAQGLKLLSQGSNPGMRALADRSGAKGAASTYHLGFLIGPRINAAGRIGHARDAFDLLTTTDPQKRAQLTDKLHEMNAARREIEAGVQEAAISAIEAAGMTEDSVIVCAGEGWHPGVIGIVAGRLKDKYDRPVIVIGTDGETGKGSGRSITGVDLGSAVSAAREQGILTSGGGHAMAAGLSIEAHSVDGLRAFLNERLNDDVSAALVNRKLTIDGVIAPEAVTGAFVDMVSMAGPYGPGNPEPIFALRNMRKTAVRMVGDAHLAVELIGAGGEKIRAIAFRAVGEPMEDILRSDRELHVVGKISRDTWRGGDAAQFEIRDAAH